MASDSKYDDSGARASKVSRRSVRGSIALVREAMPALGSRRSNVMIASVLIVVGIIVGVSVGVTSKLRRDKVVNAFVKKNNDLILENNALATTRTTFAVLVVSVLVVGTIAVSGGYYFMEQEWLNADTPPRQYWPQMQPRVHHVKVRHQSDIGSCASFAVAAALEDRCRKDLNEEITVSPAYFHEMGYLMKLPKTVQHLKSGFQLDAVLGLIVKQKGWVTEEEWPYFPNRYRCREHDCQACPNPARSMPTAVKNKGQYTYRLDEYKEICTATQLGVSGDCSTELAMAKIVKALHQGSSVVVTVRMKALLQQLKLEMPNMEMIDQHALHSLMLWHYDKRTDTFFLRNSWGKLHATVKVPVKVMLNYILIRAFSLDKVSRLSQEEGKKRARAPPLKAEDFKGIDLDQSTIKGFEVKDDHENQQE